MNDETQFPNAGIEYEATGELIEQVEADNLPKHTDGNNVALRTEGHTLCWTEDLGMNIINLDGYLHADWCYGHEEIHFDDGRIFIPDEIEMNFVLPTQELIEAAEKRAAEDHSRAAYVLGGWVCQAEGADHVNERSVRRMRVVFNKVKESEYQPDDATSKVHHGGRDR